MFVHALNQITKAIDELWLGDFVLRLAKLAHNRLQEGVSVSSGLCDYHFLQEVEKSVTLIADVWVRGAQILRQSLHDHDQI